MALLYSPRRALHCASAFVLQSTYTVRGNTSSVASESISSSPTLCRTKCTSFDGCTLRLSRRSAASRSAAIFGCSVRRGFVTVNAIRELESGDSESAIVSALPAASSRPERSPWPCGAGPATWCHRSPARAHPPAAGMVPGGTEGAWPAGGRRGLTIRARGQLARMPPGGCPRGQRPAGPRTPGWPRPSPQVAP